MKQALKMSIFFFHIYMSFSLESLPLFLSPLKPLSLVRGEEALASLSLLLFSAAPFSSQFSVILLSLAKTCFSSLASVFAQSAAPEKQCLLPLRVLSRAPRVHQCCWSSPGLSSRAFESKVSLGKTPFRSLSSSGVGQEQEEEASSLIFGKEWNEPQSKSVFRCFAG